MADEKDETTTNNDRQAESQKKVNEAKKTALELAKELIEKNKIENDQAVRRQVLDMEYLARVGQTNAARKAALDLIEKVTNAKGSLTQAESDLYDVEEKLDALRNKTTPLTEKEIEKVQQLEKDVVKLNKARTEAANTLNEMRAAEQAAVKTLKEVGEIRADDQKGVEQLTKTFESMTMGLISATGAADHGITKFGLFVSDALKPTADTVQIVSEAFGAVFNPLNIAASLFDTVKNSTIGMAKEFDSAAASFSKVTGLAREYNDVLYSTQRVGNQFGVTAKESGDAMASLISEFSQFHKTSPAVQKDLTLNVGKLNKLGVSTGESAKLLQNFNKIMGMSGKQAIETTKKIGMMGTQIGISTSKMLKDYTASLKTLAVYGDKSIDVFTGIAAAAKSAGVETGTLLSMVEKFDTFTGAAEGAGKLNAILGSQLSATEMLMMTEDERLKTMISTVQATGQSFASMDKFTQKAIAQAAGISDMAEANKIFGMSMSEFESYEMQMKQSSKAQEKFDAAIQASIPLQEKLKILSNEFAGVFLPVLTGVTYVLEFLIGVMRAIDKISFGYGTTIMGVAAGVYMFAKAVGILNLGFVKSLGLKAKDLLASGAKRVAQVLGMGVTQSEIVQEEIKQNQQKRGIIYQNLANQTAAAGVKPMLALGAAILMIGGGIYLAATGLAEFVKAFSLLTGEQLQYASLGLVVFTLAFTGLIAVLAAMVTGPQAVVAAGALYFLLGVGAAALMIGGGIYLAATGMAAFIESLSGLDDAADAMDSLTGSKDVAVNVATRLLPISKFLGDVKAMDIKNELENIALITTGTSANLMTENAVSNLVTVASLADQIKNIFNAEIVINIDGDAVKDLFEDGVYKTSMGNT